MRGYSQGDVCWVFQIINDDLYITHTRDYLEAVFYTGFCGYHMDIETEESDCGGYLEQDKALERAKGLVDEYLEEQDKCEHVNVTVCVNATFKATLNESITGKKKYYIDKTKEKIEVQCDNCKKVFTGDEVECVDPKYVDINVPIIKK